MFMNDGASIWQVATHRPTAPVGRVADGRSDSIQDMASALSEARRSGSVARDADLRRLRSRAEADTVQALAAMAYGAAPRGHAMAATSTLTARLLRCEGPVFGPLYDEHMVPSGSIHRLPRGVLGVGAGFSFVIGRSFPVGDDGEAGRNVADVVAAAYPHLQVLGRRVPNGEPLNDWAATADFGLDVLHVRGEEIENWHEVDFAGAGVALRLDDSDIGAGRGRDVMGHPIAPLAWLARALADRGSSLEAGDVIATGSCTGLAQIVPGLSVTGDFGALGRVLLKVT